MIILASASQRRIDLLLDAGLKFDVVPSLIEEKVDEKLSPEENVMEIAKTKAYDVFSKFPDALVIAADTVVVYQNEIFGKPSDEEDAFQMLKKLNGKTHDVITGVVIVNKNKEEVFYSKTQVTFIDLTDEEIKSYVETKEPFGKAGSYAIQGLGKKLVKTYNGDFFTIVGLPLKEVLSKIATFK